MYVFSRKKKKLKKYFGKFLVKLKKIKSSIKKKNRIKLVKICFFPIFDTKNKFVFSQ